MRANIRLMGDDVIHMQRERSRRMDQLAAESQTHEKHSLEMLGRLAILGLLLTGILLVWWSNTIPADRPAQHGVTIQ